MSCPGALPSLPEGEPSALHALHRGARGGAHGAERPFGEKWMPLRMVADADSAQAGLPPLDSSRCRADSYSYTSTGSGDEEWSSSGLGTPAAPCSTHSSSRFTLAPSEAVQGIDVCRRIAPLRCPVLRTGGSLPHGGPGEDVLAELALESEEELHQLRASCHLS